MRIVDLFCGAGLFSEGFTQVGYEPVLGVEIDKIAGETFTKNHDCDLIVGDIQRVAPKSIKADVIVAGPPCQGFSTLGKRQVRDKRNTLTMAVAQWAVRCKPKVVVVENVPQFLKASQCYRLKQAFVDLGFEVQLLELNAHDFGVAQLRRRAFVVASKIGPIEPRKSTKIRTVRDAFENLPDKNLDPMRYAPKPTDIARDRIKHIPVGGDKRDIMERAPDLAPPSWWAIPNQATDVWGRMLWDEPSNTLRTCFQSPSKGRYLHPSKNRVISLREGARLHSVPDTYKFVGTPTQITRQIGNGVPPLLGRAIARAILRRM